MLKFLSVAQFPAVRPFCLVVTSLVLILYHFDTFDQYFISSLISDRTDTFYVLCEL